MRAVLHRISQSHGLARLIACQVNSCSIHHQSIQLNYHYPTGIGIASSAHWVACAISSTILVLDLFSRNTFPSPSIPSHPSPISLHSVMIRTPPIYLRIRGSSPMPLIRALDRPACTQSIAIRRCSSKRSRWSVVNPSASPSGWIRHPLTQRARSRSPPILSIGVWAIGVDRCSSSVRTRRARTTALTEGITFVPRAPAAIIGGRGFVTVVTVARLRIAALRLGRIMRTIGLFRE